MANPIMLRTQRLLLRPPLPDDVEQITERIGLKDVAWNLGRAPYPYQRTDAEEWLQRIPQGWAENTGYFFVPRYLGFESRSFFDEPPDFL